MNTSDNNDSLLMYEVPVLTELQCCKTTIVAGTTETDLEEEGQGYGITE